MKRSLSILVALLVVSGPVMAADTVLLKDGTVIEGEIVAKTGSYLALNEKGKKIRRTYYLTEQVEKVNGGSFSAFRFIEKVVPPAKKIVSKREKYPTVAVLLKDGGQIKGSLITQERHVIRILPEGQETVRDILRENIDKIEP